MFCVVTSLKCLALNAYSGYLYDYYTFLDGQINRHRCTDSPLFDAHEWLGVLAWAESSWGQRRALAARWQWAFQHILSYASHTKWLGFCVCACVCARAYAHHHCACARHLIKDFTECYGDVEVGFGLPQMFTCWTLTPVQSEQGSDSSIPVSMSSQTDTKQGLAAYKITTGDIWRHVDSVRWQLDGKRRVKKAIFL